MPRQTAQLSSNPWTDTAVDSADADRRPAPTAYSNANLVIGGTTAPYLAFNMPAVVFDVPTHGIEDIITVSVNFKAQEPVDTVTTGGEVNLYAKK